jgi:hypothetical protein
VSETVTYQWSGADLADLRTLLGPPDSVEIATWPTAIDDSGIYYWGVSVLDEDRWVSLASGDAPSEQGAQAKAIASAKELGLIP